MNDVLLDCEAYQRKEKASKDFDQLNLKNKDKDSASEPTIVNAVMPGGTSKKQKSSNKGKKGGRGTNRGRSNSGQAH